MRGNLKVSDPDYIHGVEGATLAYNIILHYIIKSSDLICSLDYVGEERQFNMDHLYMCGDIMFILGTFLVISATSAEKLCFLNCTGSQPILAM